MKPGMKLTILLVIAVCFWSGLFYFASCSGRPEKRAVEIAERALKATVDNPESIQIKGISKADSVFGKEYVNQHEKAALSMHLMQYGHKLMEETDYFQNLDKDDTAMSDQVTRQLDAMTTLRALIAYGEMEEAIDLSPSWLHSSQEVNNMVPPVSIAHSKCFKFLSFIAAVFQMI